MAAANERVGEYQRYSTQFCKRLFDFLAVIFRFQVRLLPGRQLEADVTFTG